MVHDLVRDAAVRGGARRELVAAHRQVAELHLARLERDERGKGAIDPTDAVDAIHHLVQAGEADEAWELTARTYRTVAAAGLDHLLLDDLRAIATALDSGREPIALMTARIQVRRSLIAEAAETLSAIGDRGDQASQRWLVLSGEVAQRRGRLGDAEAFFHRAIAAADRAHDRFQTELALADVYSLRGRNREARDVLDAALAALPEPSPRDRARWGWSLTLSYVIEERFAAAASAARTAAEGIAGAGLDDLELLLAMLEVLARCECDDIARARQLIERVVSRAVAVGALREHVVDLYSGVVRYFTGDAVGARTVLARAFEHLAGHADHVLASIGGYYMARSALALGDVAGAIDTSTQMTRLATDFGLETLAPHGRAAQAEVHLVAGRLAEARSFAEAAMTGRSGAGARFLARLV
ncbi:MAG: tetratricopeptide repeat protein, partial [Myxococcales bacterium]|nr:tetratricopeptide repeat protein [Myxococcales bacterium]